MKVALIDIGVSRNEVGNKMLVRHFSFDNGKIVEKYKEPEEEHGTRCFKEIVLNVKNTNLQILDLNIVDDSGTLQVNQMIAAIEKAIKEQADIINISLGLTEYSQELYDICKKAVESNIVILSAASHNNTISFPADFNNVICVNVDQKQNEKIRTTGANTVTISMKDYIITENGEEFDFSSSSMACARVCGYFCDALGDRPLNDKYKVLLKKYNVKIQNSDNIHCDNTIEACEIKNILSNNRTAVVLLPENATCKIKTNMLHKNIVAYYDYEKGGFYGVADGKETADFDVIMLLSSLYCDLQFPATIKEKYRDYRIICIGNFLEKNDNEYLYDYDKYKASEMTVLERPVIAVVGLCSGLNKTDVQIGLLNKLKGDGLDIKAISNNPIGLLYDMDVFTYPTELKFPEFFRKTVFCLRMGIHVRQIRFDIEKWRVIEQIQPGNRKNRSKLLIDAYLFKFHA